MLRVEDAVVSLPGKRALFLLVSTDLSVIEMILGCFTRAMNEAGASVEGLQWYAELGSPIEDSKGWDPLFESLADWPDDSSR